MELSATNYIGWVVEWGEITNKHRGSVIKALDNDLYLIYDVHEKKMVEVATTTRFVKISPESGGTDLQYAIEDAMVMWEEQGDLDTARTLLYVLEGLQSKGLDAMDTLLKSISPKRKKSPGKKSSTKKSVNFEMEDSSSDQEESENGEDESEDEEDESEGNDSEDEESEEDSNEDEDDDEDDEDEDESSEEESSDEEEEKISIKVDLSISQDVRAFRLVKHRVIREIHKQLEKDYGARPKLYYHDHDGDNVVLLRKSDFTYAYKSHISRKNVGTMRLYAQFDDLASVSTDDVSKPRLKSETAMLDTTSAASEDPKVNRMVWQRGEIIGAGSFAQVYSGIDLHTGRRIAVKEVQMGTSKREREQAKALKLEISILAQLDHPNIIKYLGAESIKGTLRIFLELAAEGSMKDILNEFGPLSEPLLRKYMVDILNGLSFLHSEGYIHRDVKPSNLLIDKQVVKLADFGCSTSVKLDSAGINSELQHATVIGTTIYMSPEVMKGGEQDGKGYGRKADIWSLGITFCEMATAKAPFSNAASAIYCVCVSKELPCLPSSFTEEAISFLSKCLIEEPTDRASCQLLLEHPFCQKPLVSEGMETMTRHTTSTVHLNIDHWDSHDLSASADEAKSMLNDMTDDSFIFKSALAQSPQRSVYSIEKKYSSDFDADDDNDLTATAGRFVR